MKRFRERILRRHWVAFFVHFGVPSLVVLETYWERTGLFS